MFDLLTLFLQFSEAAAQDDFHLVFYFSPKCAKHQCESACESAACVKLVFFSRRN